MFEESEKGGLEAEQKKLEFLLDSIMDQFLEDSEALSPCVDFLESQIGSVGIGSSEYIQKIAEMEGVLHALEGLREQRHDRRNDIKRNIDKKILTYLSDDDASIAGLSEVVGVFVRERQRAKLFLKMGITKKEAEEMKPAHLEGLMECLRLIEDSIQNTKPIGVGTTSQVFAITGKDEICIKVLNEKDAHNAPHEFQMLNDLDGHEVDGVRSPKPLKAYSGGDLNAVLMENFDATEMTHVLDGGVALPDQFDLDAFEGSLKAYVDSLHEMGVAHGTIAPRNVMIDRKTGLPRIVDFGNAAREKEVDQNMWDILVSKDSAGVQQCISGLRKLVE